MEGCATAWRRCGARGPFLVRGESPSITRETRALRSDSLPAPFRGGGAEGAGSKRQPRSYFFLFALSITTFVFGTSWWPPFEPVATAAILSTTSMPESTRPKTA